MQYDAYVGHSTYEWVNDKEVCQEGFAYTSPLGVPGPGIPAPDPEVIAGPPLPVIVVLAMLVGTASVETPPAAGPGVELGE